MSAPYPVMLAEARARQRQAEMNAKLAQAMNERADLSPEEYQRQVREILAIEQPVEKTA